MLCLGLILIGVGTCFAAVSIPPILQCGENEEVVQCSIRCEAKCIRPTNCWNNCDHPSCGCITGYFRHPNGTCVRREQCPWTLNCPYNEVMTRCTAHCEPKCGEPRIKACTMQCSPTKCACKPNNARNSFGVCVPINDCGADLQLITTRFVLPYCEQTFSDNGTSCSNGQELSKPVNRFYWDAKINSCRAFKWYGCGDASNSFDDIHICYEHCHSSDSGLSPCHHKVPLNGYQHACNITTCPDGYQCQNSQLKIGFSNFGLTVCCNAELEKKRMTLFQDWCPSNTVSLRLVITPHLLVGDSSWRNIPGPITVIGETCETLMCPDRYECHQINSMGAKCCEVPQRPSCFDPKSEGNCRQQLHNVLVQRWYWDMTENKCMGFMFSGCGGNGNNYASIDDCLKECKNVRPDRPPCIGDMKSLLKSAPGTGAPIRPEMPIESCDHQDAKCPNGYLCMRDIFGIALEPVCCDEKAEATSVTEVVNMTKSGAKQSDAPFSAMDCTSEVDVGTECGNAKQSSRWYYNTEKQKCLNFWYNGCSGNSNRFLTKNECTKRCVRRDRSPCRTGDQSPPIISETGQPVHPMAVPQYHCFRQGLQCPDGYKCKCTYCYYGMNARVCCNETTVSSSSKLYDEAYNATCENGAQAYSIWTGDYFDAFFGDNCDTLKCPFGFSCQQVNSMFAKCCRTFRPSYRTGNDEYFERVCETPCAAGCYPVFTKVGCPRCHCPVTWNPVVLEPHQKSACTAIPQCPGHCPVSQNTTTMCLICECDQDDREAVHPVRFKIGNNATVCLDLKPHSSYTLFSSEYFGVLKASVSLILRGNRVFTSLDLQQDLPSSSNDTASDEICAADSCPDGQVCQPEPKQCNTIPCPQFRCESVKYELRRKLLPGCACRDYEEDIVLTDVRETNSWTWPESGPIGSIVKLVRNATVSSTDPNLMELELSDGSKIATKLRKRIDIFTGEVYTCFSIASRT